MKQQLQVTFQVLMLVSAITCPLCLLPRIAGRHDVEQSGIACLVHTSDSDGGRSVVPGALVKLVGPSFSQQTVTNDQGRYGFMAVATNTYQIDVTAPGLSGSSTVAFVSGTALDASVELKVQSVKESVTVTGSTESSISMYSADQTVLNKSTILNAPNRQERVDALLPLIPGVVRGPDGFINMKGARTSQGGFLVNSANTTDPATGNPAMNLPVDVVDSVKVIANPYDPEYGRLTGAVASVETVTGNFNTFHVTAQNLIVRPRRRNGDFVGIESATPRITVTGPLVKNKIAFTQSFEYRFIRTPVSSLPQLQRDMKFEGYNSFSQLDVTLSQRQSLTASFALYPQKLNYLGLNTFNPQPSTPDLHQRGYMGSIQHRYAFGADTLLVSQVSYKRFDADVTPNSNDAYQLLVETTQGGFFDRQHRETRRTEWQGTSQVRGRNLFGAHQFKIGTDFAHSDYDGRITLLPVSIIGASNLPLERIGFGPASRFVIHQNEIAAFLADKWAPFQRLTLDLGMSLDRDSVTDSINAAPRAGFALMLTRDAKTLLKSAFALFYDRVPLDIASFPFLPGRTITSLAPAGEILSSVEYANTITAGLPNPRSLGLDIEIHRHAT